ncbi:MAG: hypothetical protein V1743_00425 [Nanoarchaeota archaeon]
MQSVGMDKKSLKSFEKKVKDLSQYETKELLMINTYKLALARAQLDALSDILVKHRLATREEIWKKTKEEFDDSAL